MYVWSRLGFKCISFWWSEVFLHNRKVFPLMETEVSGNSLPVFSATKDISNLFTLFYIMVLVFVRSLHSQPVSQWGLWWIEMGLDTLTQEDGRSWFFWLNLNGFMHSPLLFFTQLFPDKNPPWQFERTGNITKLVNEGRNWEVEIWLRLLWPSFNLNQSLRYGNP